MKNIRLVVCLLSFVLCFAVVSHAQGLVGLWLFDEGSGEVVADSSGQGNNGTIVNPDAGLGENGSVWVNDPERGMVISFGGEAGGAYVLVGDGLIPTMTFDQDFTWAFWAKQAAGNSTNHIIFGNRMDINATDFVPRSFIKFTPTKFEWHANGNGDDNLDYADIPDDVWIHHAVVKRGVLLTYYRNGVEAAAQTITQEVPQPSPLFFGGDNEGQAGENWTGYLDNARIYDKALSSKEVAILSGALVESSVGDSSLGYR